MPVAPYIDPTTRIIELLSQIAGIPMQPYNDPTTRIIELLEQIVAGGGGGGNSILKDGSVPYNAGVQQLWPNGIYNSFMSMQEMQIAGHLGQVNIRENYMVVQDAATSFLTGIDDIGRLTCKTPPPERTHSPTAQ